MPYSAKAVIKNKKTGIVFGIVELHLYPRHLYPQGIVNNCGSAALDSYPLSSINIENVGQGTSFRPQYPDEFIMGMDKLKDPAQRI